MTGTDAKERPAITERPPPDETRRKATLFCPVCDFEAPVGRGWVDTDDDGPRGIACPNCGTVVSNR